MQPSLGSAVVSVVVAAVVVVASVFFSVCFITGFDVVCVALAVAVVCCVAVSCVVVVVVSSDDAVVVVVVAASEEAEVVCACEELSFSDELLSAFELELSAEQPVSSSAANAAAIISLFNPNIPFP